MENRTLNDIWLKRVLVPFWVIETDTPSSISVVELPFAAVSIILDITAIILFARRNLSTTTYLVFQCLKGAGWAAMFLIDVIFARYGTAKDLLFTIVLLGTSVGQVAYGSVLVHRKRKGTLIHDCETHHKGVDGMLPSYTPSEQPVKPQSGGSVGVDPVKSRAFGSSGRQGGVDYYNGAAAQQSYELQGVARQG
ncbi:hypothetical protein LTR56_019054 [Elasticomyces elasticus]|nr:hypothetical protein LTR56_019054 [Elasticomyces elasticus]KAK3645044.1 hypothetical protein LTR22_014963 [Elasticomyces elasticus]KAK4907199.1 hypothetical protein LTR49_023766 [Elasticomyces elasticus]KAK5747583.1 hypothetical protein LTS12_022374 [Elasticomyces elasticus]